MRPLGAFFWGKNWTLAAWCELRQDYRSFRPDRMEDVKLLDAVFDDSDGIGLAEFAARMEAEERAGPACEEPSSEPARRARAARIP